MRDESVIFFISCMKNQWPLMFTSRNRRLHNKEVLFIPLYNEHTASSLFVSDIFGIFLQTFWQFLITVKFIRSINCKRKFFSSLLVQTPNGQFWINREFLFYPSQWTMPIDFLATDSNCTMNDSTEWYSEA